jgi:uncharacterized protein (TIGR02996 family)
LTAILTDRDTLLRNVLADPADDAPRLIYADYLSEHGDEADRQRSELIRLQIRLASLGPARKRYDCVDTFVFRRNHGFAYVEGEPVGVGERIDLYIPEDENSRDDGEEYKRSWPGVFVEIAVLRGTYERRRRTEIEFRVDAESVPWPGDALCRRERRLLDEHRHSLTPRVPGCTLWIDGVDGPRVGSTDSGVCCAVYVAFRRGFVDSINLPCADFMQHAGVIFASSPVRVVVLTGRRPAVIGGMQFWRMMADDQDLPMPHDLPLSLFKHLKKSDLRRLDAFARYTGQEAKAAALADLAQAAVAFGRHAAGLPELATR